MKNQILSELCGKLHLDNAEQLCEAEHGALCHAIFEYARERILSMGDQPQAANKQVSYVSMEILPGRTLSNNLMNLPEAKALMEIMHELGIDVNEIEKMEKAPKLGNGGLGRLAGCMVESASSQNIPMTVHTLRFRRGFFRQDMANGRQEEKPDRWFDQAVGYPFEIKRANRAQEIHFSGATVKAVPYDIPVIGMSSGGNPPQVNYIRMWALDDPDAYDDLYQQIDEKLYPDDSDMQGKALRLMQEYFLSAATVGDMIRTMEENHWNIARLPEKFALHINDTHPVLMIPELMRILRSDYRLDEDAALGICRGVFAYTNHTIMAEALECWDIPLLESLLPDVYHEIDCLHHRFDAEINDRYSGDGYEEKRRVMDILWDGKARMANLAIYVSHHVNGVAEIHTDILKKRELKDFHEFFPGKFVSITNGVTQRKWLIHANPELTAMINRRLGISLAHMDFNVISRLAELLDQEDVLTEFEEIRMKKKQQLSEFVQDCCGIDLPSHFIFDIHVKRMHEYKRQLLNCFRIIALYQWLKNNPSARIHPIAFIFAAKAAPAYTKAKLIIELIKALETLVNTDPDVNQMLRVVFIPDYDVSKAELIIPAADVSEQISTASKEASGTGNMKFMLNGALTLGTLDGANVEICDAVGAENMYIFGLTMDEVMDYEAHPGMYDIRPVLDNSPELAKVIHALRDGTICRKGKHGEEATFSELTNELLYGEYGKNPDRYFLLKDFADYMATFFKMNSDYANRAEWYKKALANIAASGRFSSDRTVREYAEMIWNL